MVSLPQPDPLTCTRRDVHDYFDNTWGLTRLLFSGLADEQAFYGIPDHGLRHPLIFYYAHPAAFYVNKLRLAGLIAHAVNAPFEELFETGVDEMSWDDISKNDRAWPPLAAVKDYRAQVKRLVTEVIENVPLPATMHDPAWALFMAFEHERIHLETSSVLIRELPLRLVRTPDAWPKHGRLEGHPAKGFVTVPAATAELGKSPDAGTFGWDNEYGRRTLTIGAFHVAARLVSNADYLEFVQAGGYRERDWWSAEGWRWRSFRNAKWPRFWVPAGPAGMPHYRLRITFEEMDMPGEWPVCVNHHEATAYCAWRSRVDGVDYHLPSEAQHHLMRAAGGRANNNLEFGSESAPMPPNELGLSDVFGNVWQWCADDFNPLPGSRPHPYYDDFSTPCYDGDHRIILGGSFISTGDEASPWARFHFRPHFLQQAGIRLVSSTDQGKPYRYARDGYESEEMLDRYLLLHYGTVSESLADGLPRESVGFPQRIAERLVRVARDHDVPLRRALDAGCAVGGATFALSKHFDEVVGIDASRRFIDAATRLARTGTLAYLRRDGAGRTSPLTATVEPRARRDRTRFEWGDLTDLDSGLGAFDALLVSNVLCRLSRPRAFLDRLTSLLLPGGVVLFATPWSWSDEHTPESQWVDGVEALADALGPEYQLIGRDDELATLRIHARRYEVIRPEITIWHRDRASTR